MKPRLINFIIKGHYTVGIALFIVLGLSILGAQKVLNFHPDSGWWGTASAFVLTGAILSSTVPLYRLFYYFDYKFWPASEEELKVREREAKELVSAYAPRVFPHESRATKFIDWLLRKLLAGAIMTVGLLFAAAIIILYTYIN